MSIGSSRRVAGAKRLAALSALLMLVSACSLGSSRNSASDPGQQPPKSGGGNLQNRIAVAPFEVQSQHTDPYSDELMQSYILGAIRSECSGIEWIKPSDKDYPAVLRSIPRLESGELDNLQAAAVGRQLGLSAVMVGTLTSVGIEEKESGIWPLKRNRHYVRVQVLFEIYDTETATKLLDEAAARQVEIEAIDAAMIKQKNRVDSGFVEEVLEIIAQKVDDNICDAVGEQVWKSYVLSAGPDELWIASGSRSGLQPGQVLEVFDSNTVIEGYNGHKYFKPGPKIAEVELVAVESRRSKAAVLTGGDIQPLNVVKIKK
jgi:hypothetical protein